MAYKLRDYQQLIVDLIRQAFREGDKEIIAVLSTGGGKTIIFAEIARLMAARGKAAVVLVHRRELLKQAIEKIQDFGINVGAIAPGYRFNYSASVHVASVQTLVGRMHKINIQPDLIITDECHHATANSYKKVYDYYSKAWLVGVTATPERTDGTGLGLVFKRMIQGPQLFWLIQQGFLSKVVYHRPKSSFDFDEVPIERGDFSKGKAAEIIDNKSIIGEVVDTYEKVANGLTAVYFCVNVAHAEHVANEFKARGHKATHVDGKLEEKEREDRLSGLATGKYTIVTSCDLIGEGLDIPAIQVSGLLRPTISRVLIGQQIGRALRPIYTQGFPLDTVEQRLHSQAVGVKKHAIILDHVNAWQQHAEYVASIFTDAEVEWSLESDKKNKKKKKSDIDEDVLPVKQCESCYKVFDKQNNGLKCPYCGHVHAIQGRKISTKEGDLVELTAEDLQQLKEEKKNEQKKAQTLEDLKVIEVARGYKRGWAKHVYNSRRRKAAY